jgi:subtilisin family serine protease
VSATELLPIGVAFKPGSTPAQQDAVIENLKRHGFELTIRGRVTASFRATREEYESTLGRGGHLVLPANAAASVAHGPASAVASHGQVSIQQPHIYLRNDKGVSATPPSVRRNAFFLRPPAEIAELTNAHLVHEQGGSGTGVRVVMIDSGFDHSHPFFQDLKVTSNVVFAPSATKTTTDPDGHGTGISANLFAIAPGVDFTGIKLDNDDRSAFGSTVLEGLQRASQLDPKPHIISLSVANNLMENGAQMTALPEFAKPLEQEILAAIEAGTIVVCAAGNGEFAFPGQMPDVISAGGVFVPRQGDPVASDFASAFESRIYPGRRVPDLCGLVGLARNEGAYIALPVPPGSPRDTSRAHKGDGTEPDDGWAIFSGTSSAAPQIAAVCALLLEKKPGLEPAQIKQILCAHARDIRLGSANARTGTGGQGAGTGRDADPATGAGLVDAFAAWKSIE